MFPVTPDISMYQPYSDVDLDSLMGLGKSKSRASQAGFTQSWAPSSEKNSQNFDFIRSYNPGHKSTDLLNSYKFGDYSDPSNTHKNLDVDCYRDNKNRLDFVSSFSKSTRSEKNNLYKYYNPTLEKQIGFSRSLNVSHGFNKKESTIDNKTNLDLDHFSKHENVEVSSEFKAPAKHRLSVDPPDTNFHFRIFNANSSRNEKDFFHSMKLNHSEKNGTQTDTLNVSSRTNPFEEDDPPFVSSVQVLAKTSGDGYQIVRSNTSKKHESSVSDTDGQKQFSDGYVANTDNAQNTSRSIGPRPGTIPRSQRFSRNIANPSMQKKVHDKLLEATNRSEIYRSSNDVSQPSHTRSRSTGNEINSSNKFMESKSKIVKTDSNKSSRNSGLIDRRNHVIKIMHQSASDPQFSSGTDNSLPSSGDETLTNLENTLTSNSSRFTNDNETHTSPDSTLNKQPNTEYPKPQKHVLSRKSLFAIHRKKTKNLDAFQDGVIHANTDNQVGSSHSFSDKDTPKSHSGTMYSDSHRPDKDTPKSHSGTMYSDSHRPRTFRTSRNGVRHCGNNQRHSNSEEECDCGCRNFHSHRFLGEPINQDIEERKERRNEAIMASMRLEEEEGQTDGVDDPRNVFWIPALSFHGYKHGDPLVRFSSLWPRQKELREYLQNSGIQQTVVRDEAVLDLCVMAVTCGPVYLLRTLIELGLIRVDQITDSGAGLLHLAVLAHNLESVHYLMSAKVSPKIKDRQGLTADQVCFNPSIKKQMAPRYVLNREESRGKVLLTPSLQDKDHIFRLAANPKSFVDLQKKLQSLDFNVNTECDNNGDFLLHIAVRNGLSQLPLLMALIKIQGADIELCNIDGMTPLMMAAAAGNCVLCDVLICLFGADPNKQNSQTGRSALHYAVEGNHRKTVECLIRRGSDVNMEDHDGLRPDDIPACNAVTDDCAEVILFNREKRLDLLCDLVRKGEVVTSQLLPSDLYVVDGDGHTLLMIAAIYNRFHTLRCLLEVSQSTINAQHRHTGMTALAIAAQMGNVEAVSILLRHKACPTIADMNGHLPLHHAVLNNHESTVDAFLEVFPDTYQGLHKARRLCKKTSIHLKLKLAWDKRQEEIVTPKLLGCALNGHAGDLYLLLDEGDNINPKSGTGNWPLYLAVENGHLEVLKLLCERGGDIRKRHPTTGATVLHVASKMGHHSMVTYLLQFCGPPTASQTDQFSQPVVKRKMRLDVNAVDGERRTALQLAAERGYSRIVEMLLSSGATSAMLDSEGQLVTCPQYEGVRIMIESNRKQHTKHIIRCILDKSKKSLSDLEQIWLPRFDHHLRDKEGNTPLMVACQSGKAPVIKFLLQSAVYSEQLDTDQQSEEEESDSDSGVLDQTFTSRTDFNTSQSFDHRSFLTSTDATGTPRNDDKSRGSAQTNLTNSLEEFYHRKLDRFVFDANRPKGLSIYHDGLVSHVCAVNLLDKSTCLHQTVKAADSPQILNLLLDTDPTPLNFQDQRGETVLHLACRLSRRKCVELLLARQDLDLNIRTLDGLLPEEVPQQKSIRRMVEKTRALLPIPTSPEQMSPLGESLKSPSLVGSVAESTINFDKLQLRYQEMKQEAGNFHT